MQLFKLKFKNNIPSKQFRATHKFLGTLRIHISSVSDPLLLMWIRIRISGSDLKSKIMQFYGNLWDYYLRVLNKISDFFFKNYILKIFTNFIMIFTSFATQIQTFPEVDPYLAKWYGPEALHISIRTFAIPPFKILCSPLFFHPFLWKVTNPTS